ncbi:MAG: replicative DNA helicase [Candidatus Brocadiales bacterium]
MTVGLMLERTPPQNIDAEVGVLGAMLLDNDTVNLAVQMLYKDSFYKTAHQELFQTIVDIYDRDRAVDLVILKEELKKHSLLEKVGGIEYLMELEESVPTAANIEHYARILQEKAVKRSLIDATVRIQKDSYEEMYDSDTLLDKAESLVFEIGQRKASRTPSTKLIEILTPVFNQIEKHHDKKGKLTGLSTGYTDLDDITCGLQPSELIIVAGRPSMGKTSLGLNILQYVGVVENKPAVLFSLEMSSNQVAQNMLCSCARINAHSLRRGFLNDNEWSQLSLAMGTLSEGAIFIDDTPGLSILELKAKARRLKSQHDIQLIVVDYMQLMEAPRAENRQQEISVISRGLKSLARELGIPIIAVSQLNRSVESREGNRPRMSDLRESGSIEQDADVIMLLYREEYYATEEKPAKKPGVAEIIIAKQRNGPVGSVSLSFIKEFMRFESLAHSEL